MKNKSATVLIIDDDVALLSAIRRKLELAAYRALTASDVKSGRGLCAGDSIQAVLLDTRVPTEQDGMETLRWLREVHPEIPVIMMSAYGTIGIAVNALKMGAFDYLEKDNSDFGDKLLNTLRNAIEKNALEAERSGLLLSLQSQYEMIGDSPAMVSLRSAIQRVAPTDERVLILGETGTGKELVAQSIFSHSRRASKPFIKVNCAAIPKDLIESELFGHKRGSFTGAAEDRKGKFKSADGGTIFLDEIGDMSPVVQAKLLRVLQAGEIEPVGGEGTEQVDVRVIAATNQNVEKMCDDGAFRKDLYFRLKSVVLHVPPLRERLEDVPALMKLFLERAAGRNNRSVLTLCSDALDLLLQHDWPGNVRELESLAAWLSVFAPGPEVHAHDLTGWFGQDAGAGEEVPGLKDYQASKENFEREYFKRLLILLEGNMTAVAQTANLDRSGLYRKLKSLGIVE